MKIMRGVGNSAAVVQEKDSGEYRPSWHLGQLDNSINGLMIFDQYIQKKREESLGLPRTCLNAKWMPYVTPRKQLKFEN